MSSSTALLPKDRKKDDHPIFLRVCHSPWSGLDQRALSALRGILAIYLIVGFAINIKYEFKHHRGWLIVFALPNISYFLQVIYHCAAFSWTFMHLHYPHHGSQPSSHATRFQKLLSPPRQNATTKNRTFFSIFYTAAVTFPHVVTLIHWTILVPKLENTIPVDGILRDNRLREFLIANKYGVNSIIAVIEVFFFSSIRRQFPIWAHIVGLSVLSFLYVGWTFVGYVVTDRYAYFFFDHHRIGWLYVATAILAFSALTNIFFSVVYGLTGLREVLSAKEDGKSSGYSRLPQ